MRIIYLCTLLLLPLFANAKNYMLKPLWETEGLRVPESVLVVGKGRNAYLLVSEVEGRGSELDGVGGIAKLSMDGKILAKDWVRGLSAPKGMATYKGKLFVSDIHEVVVIDLASAKILKRIEVADSVFLNDIAVDSKGIVYVSDTRTNKVHRIENTNVETYLEDVKGANGLTVVNDVLYVAGGDSLWRVPSNKKMHKIAEGFAENADGVEMIKPNEFVVSCWAGITYHVKNGKLKVLLDTREQGTNTADIGWSRRSRTVYVPTFNGNSVAAYKLKRARKGGKKHKSED